MIDDVQLLTSITEAADMGRDSLNHIIEKTTDAQLKSALQGQSGEYNSIYSQASSMLMEKGKKPQKSPAALKAYSHIVSNIKTSTADNTTSKIAEMVIQGSTMGITEITKQLNVYRGSDLSVRTLAENHLNMEQANINQMKQYL